MAFCTIRRRRRNWPTRCRRLLDGPALLKQLAAAVPAVKSIEEDAGEFATVYAEVVRRSGGVHAFPARAHDHAPTEFPATLAIVLNHRTPDDTLLAMASLRASQAPLHGSYVVENGSEDGRLEYLRSHLGDAELIVSGTNLGFSAGCNLGIRAALARGAARVFLMNSDAVLPPDSLAKMHAALDADPELGIVGPSVVSRSDPNHVLSQGMRFSTRTGRMRHLGFGRASSVLSAPHVCDVDAVSGCAMLITREVFDCIGLFEESVLLRLRGPRFLPACTRGRVPDGVRGTRHRASRRRRFNRRAFASADLLRHEKPSSGRPSCAWRQLAPTLADRGVQRGARRLHVTRAARAGHPRPGAWHTRLPARGIRRRPRHTRTRKAC